MRLSFLPSNVTPIAIDFGTSSVKLLQSSTDAHAQVVAIDEFEIPDAVRMQPERRTAFHRPLFLMMVRIGRSSASAIWWQATGLAKM